MGVSITKENKHNRIRILDVHVQANARTVMPSGHSTVSIPTGAQAAAAYKQIRHTVEHGRYGAGFLQSMACTHSCDGCRKCP